MKPSQVRGDCRTENRLITKHMILLRDKEPFKGCIGGKSTYNTRIEPLWGDHNANATKHFKQAFEDLEVLLCLDTSDPIDMWVSYFV